MTAPGRIILIHGASCAGKSTLACALRDAAPVPFWLYSFDSLRDTGVLPTGHPGFDWPAYRNRVFDGLHRATRAFADAGNDLIVEHILDQPGWHGDLRRLWSGLDVFFVALRLPLDELRMRAQSREDRPRRAEADHALMERDAGYDLVLDGRDSASDNAARLLAGWTNRVPHSGFFTGPLL